jgi:hypothetical protein
MGLDYLLSEGITALLEKRHGLGLSEHSKNTIRDIEHDFSESLQGFVPEGVAYHVLSERAVREGMERITRGEPLPLVSLDDVYFDHIAHGSLSVTRLTSPTDPNNYEIGPRPGASPLDDQIDDVLMKLGRRIALIDVGTFNGHTLRDQVEALAHRGMHVERVYVSIANIDSDKSIEPISAYRYDFNDWVENRDLIGFDGRKPNATSNEGYLIMPYFDHLEEWASLPYSDALRELCITYRNRIIDELARDQISTNVNEKGHGIYQITFNRQLQIEKPLAELS